MIDIKENKGITLIALVITIIVLLILAGITIAQITGQDSAPEKAAQSKLENDKGAMKDTANLVVTKYIQEFYEKKYVENDPNFTYGDQGEYAEAQFATEDEGGYTYSVSSHKLTVTDVNENSVTGTINANGTITWEEWTNEPVEADTQTSYVGYYAYVDGVYGIIYADLLAQETRSGQWKNLSGEWSLPAASAANAYKSYDVRILTNSDSKFGNINTGVIAPVSGTTGLDRFYIMEISNSGSTGNWETACSITGGTNNTWRLPSKKEWSIFGSSFEITSSNYSSTYGLSPSYWSSTSFNSNSAWFARCISGYMDSTKKTNACYVRLCTTF